MLSSALYYPHTELRSYEPGSQKLLKRALLLWDKLEFIVPHPSYKPHCPDQLFAEGLELVAKNHYPNEQEKSNAHTQIEELVTRPHFPEAFNYRGELSSPYEVYPQKFLEKTWKLLRQAQMTGSLLPNSDYPLNPQAGLLIMAILADSCAGATHCRVTDRSLAYAGVANLLGEQDVNITSDEDATQARFVDITLRSIGKMGSTLRDRLFGRERLVTMKLSLFDIDQLSLQKLVDFRKKEEAQGGHAIRDLRHRYLQRVEAQVKELTTNPKLTESDLQEVERQFEQDMKDDLAALHDELKSEFTQAVCSKDVLITLIAGVGTIAATVLAASVPTLQGVVTAAGAPVTLGGVLATRSKFLKARTDILRKHPTAYFYELGGGLQI